MELGGCGEPLVHPRLPEMLERASALGVSLTLTTKMWPVRDRGEIVWGRMDLPRMEWEV